MARESRWSSAVHNGHADASVCIAYKRAFDSWLVSIFGASVGVRLQDIDGLMWPDSWPSGAHFTHYMDELFDTLPVLPRVPGIAIHDSPEAQRRFALDMLTLGDASAEWRRANSTPVQWRDEALGRLLVSGAHGDVVSLVLLALLDVFGVSSSHVHGQSLVRMYVKLVCRATVSESEATDIVFGAHAMRVCFQLECRGTTSAALRLHAVPHFADIGDVMNMLVMHDAGAMGRLYPLTTPLFVDAREYTRWPLHIRDGFMYYCEMLEVDTIVGLPPQMAWIIEAKRRREGMRAVMLESASASSRATTSSGAAAVALAMAGAGAGAGAAADANPDAFASERMLGRAALYACEDSDGRRRVSSTELERACFPGRFADRGEPHS
jgi:hypothetical protein